MSTNIFDLPDWALSNKEKIIRVYHEEKNVTAVAKKLDLSTSWVREIVREYRKFCRGKELTARKTVVTASR